MVDRDQRNLSCKVDWLSFTYKHADSFDACEYDYFLKAFPELQYAFEEGLEIKMVRNGSQRFYDSVVSFNDFFSIGYRSLPMKGKMQDCNLGVNVFVPSHGLEKFLSYFGLGVDGIAELLRLIYARGCTVSRLDLAYDDYRKTFKPFDLAQMWLDDTIVSDFASCKYITSKRGSADTFYLGKRAGGKILRVYDKFEESSGSIDAVRWEFELHGSKAAPYVSYIMRNNCAPDFRDIVSKFIHKVVDVKHYSNKSMLSCSEGWSNFLDSAYLSFCEQLEVSTFKDQKDVLKKTVYWFYEQVCPTLHTLCRLYGRDKILSLVDSSRLHSKDTLMQFLYHHKKAQYDKYIEDIFYTFTEQ